MIIFYDSYCSLCRNASRFWKKFDFFNQLTFKSFRDWEKYPPEMAESIHVQTGEKIYAGYDAVLQIIRHLPALWILLPGMYLAKWLHLGDPIYNYIAKNRRIIPVGQCEDGDNCSIYP